MSAAAALAANQAINSLPAFDWTKVLWIIAFFLGLSLFIFIMYLIFFKKRPPKKKTVPAGQWNPAPLVDSVYAAFVQGSWNPLSSGDRDIALGQLDGLNDAQLNAVFNGFNDRAFSEGHNKTLTETLSESSSWLASDELLYRVIQRLRGLNLL